MSTVLCHIVIRKGHKIIIKLQKCLVLKYKTQGHGYIEILRRIRLCKGMSALSKYIRHVYIILYTF